MEEKRINLILNHKLFKEYINKNQQWEIKREFCHHDLEHFLDVARIAYIMNLERDLGYKKDIIYAIALLHDIGRWKQYQEGTSHEVASKELSQEILIDAGYDKGERELIYDAILNHRSKDLKEDSLNCIMYKSDKLSRKCFNCPAVKNCNWSEEKKNYNIAY